MINKFLALPLILAASVVAHPVHNEPVRRQLPSLSQWPSTNESWWSYKVRYQSLSCDGQQGSDFFNTCCNPLPAGQTTANLPAECQPATLTCVNPAPSTLTVTTSSAAPAPSDNTQSDNSGSNNDNSGQTDNSGGNTWTDTSNTDNSGDNSGYTDNSWNNNNNNNGGGTTTTDNSGSTDNSGNNNGGGGGGGSSTSGDITGGYGTYFYQNGVAGACGTVHSDYDLIGAIDVAWYGDMGQQSQYCGRSVTITNLNNGAQVTITVADVCPTCDTNNSFDLSVGAFQAISDLGAGLIPISWHFN